MSADEEKQTALVLVQSTVLAKGGAKSLATRGRSHLRDKEDAKEWLRKGLELQKAAPADPNGPKAPVNPYATPLTPTGSFQSTKELADKAAAPLEKKLAAMENEFHILHESQARARANTNRISNLYDRIDKTEKQIAAIRASIGPEGKAKTGLNNEDLLGLQKADAATLLEYIKQVLAGVHPDAAAKNLGMAPEDQEMAHVANFIGVEAIAEAAKREQERKDHILRKRGEMLQEAFGCFEKGHQLDPLNTELLYLLADSYYQGFGVSKNEVKAVAIYQRAADMGHAGSQTAIGDAYAQCGFRCLPRDYKQAAKWYQAAAEQGDEEAVCQIVDMYQRGEGVEQNHAEAARLLRKAAANGDEGASDDLTVYAEMYGWPYDDSEAHEVGVKQQTRSPVEESLHRL